MSERAIDTSSLSRPCLACLPSSPLSGDREVGEIPPPSRLASPHSRPTPPPVEALCKSPHMLPRVPVSQRHSRASFCTHRNVLTNRRKGTIKRSFAFSLSLSRADTDYLAVVYRYAGRTRAREKEFFLVLRSESPTQSQSREGRRAELIEGTTGQERKRERETKGRSSRRFFHPHSRVYRHFSFFTFICIYVPCNFVESRLSRVKYLHN